MRSYSFGHFKLQTITQMKQEWELPGGREPVANAEGAQGKAEQGTVN